MDMIKVRAVNTGHRGQVLRQHGGTVEVKAGKTLDNVEILALTAAQVVHYAERGVFFVPAEHETADVEACGRLLAAVAAAKLEVEAAEADVAAGEMPERAAERLEAAGTSMHEAEAALQAAVQPEH